MNNLAYPYVFLVPDGNADQILYLPVPMMKLNRTVRNA